MSGLSLKYLIQRITAMNAQVIELFTGNVVEVDQQTPVLSLRESPTAIEELENFAKYNPGIYTVFLRKSQSSARKSGERMLLNITPQTGNEPIEGTQHAYAPQPPMDMEAMKHEMFQQIRKEMEVQMLRDELRQLQLERAKESMMEQRLSNILMHVGGHLGLFKIPDTATPLNGAQPGAQPVTPDTMPGQHNIEDLTESQEEQLTNAVDVIYSHLGLATMIKVANALERDPSLASKLNLFI